MATVVERLEQLIPFRTDALQGDEPALARFLAEELRALQPDEVLVVDVPRQPPTPMGSYVYARWGAPKLLVNAHLDTVPPNEGWSGNPFIPRRIDGRIVGLGAADTKGAIAAILAALHEIRPKDVAVLFSGDEERAGSCILQFLKSPQAKGITQAIVCEPTSCRAGTRHRGILSLQVTVDGPGGHSSRADSTRAPLADLSALATDFAEWGRAHRQVGPPGFLGMCLNVAKLDGGIAFNVIPAHASLTISARCPPGTDSKAVRAELEAIARHRIPDAAITSPLDNPSFGIRDLSAFERWLGAIVQTPIDLGFWTEAALLAEAGIDAVVIGPGDIAQAHAPDEWVAVSELEKAQQLFMNLFQQSRDGSS